MKEKNPYDNGGELSVDAVDFILTNDIKEFDKSQIINPEYKGTGRKTEKSGDDEGSTWRLTA